MCSCVRNVWELDRAVSQQDTDDVTANSRNKHMTTDISNTVDGNLRYDECGRQQDKD